MKCTHKFSLDDFDFGMEMMLAEPQLKSAIVFCGKLTPDCNARVKITRVGRNRNDYRIVTGKPAFVEREYLKQCKKAKCNPKRTWLKYYNPKKPGRF